MADVLIASETQQKQLAMLRILIGVCQTAVDAFQAADNPLDTEFVKDLERMMERTRQELEALANLIAKPSH